METNVGDVIDGCDSSTLEFMQFSVSHSSSRFAKFRLYDAWNGTWLMMNVAENDLKCWNNVQFHVSI